MGNKVSAIEAVRARISAATVAGQPLADVKRVRVGSIAEARQGADFPIINIDIVSGEEIDHAHQRVKVDNMVLEISLVCNKLDQEPATTNAYYQTVGATNMGCLYLFEALLNVLDKNSGGTVDLAFGSAANKQGIYSYEFRPSDSQIEIALRMVIQTAQFVSGSR